jgi:uncharacterized membrane protein
MPPHSRRFRHRTGRAIWLPLAVLAGMAYPLLVYLGLPFLPPSLIVLTALGLLALRLLVARRSAGSDRWLRPLLIAAVVLIAWAAIDLRTAIRAYPVLLSLAAASVFGASLLSPPTVVERLARLSEPDLPPDGVAYARTVTQVWTVFLLGNAAVAAALGLWGSLAQWTLWTGLISYLLMGSLFVGEFAVRRLIRRRT